MAYKIILTPDQKAELFKRIKKEKQVKVHRRLKSIQYKTTEMGNQNIASILGVRPETVTQWFKLFLSDGFEGLCRLKYEGRRKSGLDCHKEAIKNYIQKKTPSTLAEINDWLEKSYGLSFDETWLSRYCKKNSLFPAKKQSLLRVKHPA